MNDRSTTPAADAVLDATGLRCPLPLLRAKQAIGALARGQVLEVTATDRGAARDFPAWLRQSPHELLDQAEDADGTLRFRIRRG
jgi:TusA-related sulfurtransferase